MHRLLPQRRRVRRAGRGAGGQHKGGCSPWQPAYLSGWVWACGGPGSHASCLFVLQGICFIRTSRPESKVIYAPEEKFEVGVAKVSATLGLHACVAEFLTLAQGGRDGDLALMRAFV